MIVLTLKTIPVLGIKSVIRRESFLCTAFANKAVGPALFTLVGAGRGCRTGGLRDSVQRVSAAEAAELLLEGAARAVRVLGCLWRVVLFLIVHGFICKESGLFTALYANKKSVLIIHSVM